MSRENFDFSNLAEAVERKFPVVLRFAEMFPSALGGFAMHAARKGGQLDHIDPERTRENEILIGGPDWRERLVQEIEVARAENLAEELEALKRRKRTAELQARMLEGKTDPWKMSKKGPLREVILTANREWFAADDPMAPILGTNREEEFRQAAVQWLQSRFGASVVHARGDRDEMTYHIHAIIAPWVEKTSSRRGRQRALQPSSHPLLADYEKAQDDAGMFFSSVGLARGESTAAKRREAIKERRNRTHERERLEAAGAAVPSDFGEELDPVVPARRKHVPTPVWWAEETRRLTAEKDRLRKREAGLEEREKDANEIIAVSEELVQRNGKVMAREFRAPTKRFLTLVQKIGAAAAAKAEERAAVAVEQQRKAAEALRDAALTLLQRARNALPPKLLAIFDRATQGAEVVLRQAQQDSDRVNDRRKQDER